MKTATVRRPAAAALGVLAALIVFAAPARAAAVVRGRVYLAGRADPAVIWPPGTGRAPLPGVLVSDGYTFVETDAQGRYQLPLNEAARWVAVVNPPGTMPDPRLYRMLPAAPEIPPEVDFQLAPLALEPGRPFRFAHHSDLHLSRDYHVDHLYQAIGRHLARLPAPVLFALDSGDISIDAIEHMEWARALFDRYPVPVFTVKGNHDRDRAGREAYRGETMERLFHPLYYAFTCGNYLFLNYPWLVFRNEALAWTERLLERVGDDLFVVVNMHHWDGLRAHATELIDLLRRHNGRGAFWGHYHSTQVGLVEGLASFGINSGRSHIRDLGAPAFNLVTAWPDGRLVADQRKAGFEKNLALVNPPRGGALKRGGTVPLLVNAYDTARPVRSVRVTVRGTLGGELLARVTLENGGGMAWGGRLPAGRDWPDPVVLLVEATDDTGAVWPLLERLVGVPDPAPEARVEPGADWGMYQGGPGRPGAAAAGPAPPLELAWVHVNRNFGFSAPVVAGGRVFAALANNSDPVDPVTVMVALDARSGDTLWTHELAGGRSPRSTPATDGRRVVFQACDGFVAALDAETGRRLWESELMVSQLNSAQIFLRGSPLVSAGHAFFGLARFSAAFDLATGREQWSQLPDGGSRSWANPSSLLGAGRLFSPEGGRLRALDPATGEEAWRVSAGGNITPALGENYLFATGRDDQRAWFIRALDPADGRIAWQTPLEGEPGFSGPATGGGRVFLAHGETTGAYCADSGHPLWRVETGEAVAAPVLVGEHLYLATGGGRLLALEAASGATAWDYDLGTRVTSGLAVSGNALFVTGRNGALYAFTAPGETEPR